MKRKHIDTGIVQHVVEVIEIAEDRAEAARQRASLAARKGDLVRVVDQIAQEAQRVAAAHPIDTRVAKRKNAGKLLDADPIGVSALAVLATIQQVSDEVGAGRYSAAIAWGIELGIRYREMQIRAESTAERYVRKVQTTTAALKAGHREACEDADLKQRSLELYDSLVAGNPELNVGAIERRVVAQTGIALRTLQRAKSDRRKSSATL
jgi:hypothetical protein